MPWYIIALIAAGVALIAYWLFIYTEGVLLGQHVVTWLYDIYAKRYDSIKGFDPGNEANYLARPILEALNGIHAPYILDIGTGTGRLPIALLDSPSFQGKVIGIDDSLNMLEEAAQKLTGYGDRVRNIWWDASTLPFPDGSFDCVSILEMLEFTPDPRSQIREAVRVLDAGGLLILTRRRSVPSILMPGKIHSETEFAAMLAEIGMIFIQKHRWQVDYDLYTCWKRGKPADLNSKHMYETLTCPACGADDWLPSPDAATCNSCGISYPIKDKILLLKSSPK